MSEVYEILNLPMSKKFALKVLKPQVSEVSLKRFQKEVKAVAHLNHPSIVKVHSFGWLENKQPYMILDLLEGETLHSVLKREGSLTIDRALELCEQIALGLDYAHGLGMIHRDLKPGNIMLERARNLHESPAAKIIDFGLVKFSGTENFDTNPLTEIGTVFGTPLYMSPEQCLGEKVDIRSDIYSLGCILFECLCGVTPFSAESPLHVMMKHSQQLPETLARASMGRQFPKGLQAIVSKALAKNPDQRYQNLSAMISDLRQERCLLKGQWEDILAQNKTLEIRVHSPSDRSIVSLLMFGFIALVPITAFAILNITTEKIDFSQPNKGEKTVNASEISIHNFAERQSCFSKIIGDRKKISFPFEQSIAKVSWRPRYSQGNFEEIDNSRTSLIESNAELKLEIGWQFCRLYPSYLRMFRPEEITELTIIDEPLKRRKLLPNSESIFDDALIYANHFTRLRTLSANETPISDFGLLNLQLELKNEMRHMHLGSTLVSGKFLAKQKTLAKLKTLDLTLNDNGNVVLPYLRDITSLTLQAANISDENAEQIAELKLLKELDLRSNAAISDSSYTAIKELKNLEVLRLSATATTVAQATSLTSLTSLRVLDTNLERANKTEISRLKEVLPPFCRIKQTQSSILPLIQKSLLLEKLSK
ncbi:MAG: serine/threonine protein kinase [Leptolyngbya sp.]|nr:serine/threonine protein kinase [Candidatus Melainabacteria bacterium]